MNRFQFPAIALVLALAGLPGGPAHAETRTYAIEAQPLDTALKAFAFQSNREIFFAPELTRGKQTQGINGKYEDLAALQVILANTGLTYAVTESNAILVKDFGATAGMAAGPSAATQLAQVEEAANTQSAGAGAAAARNSSDGIGEIIVTAQKREERLQDVPISISVLSGEDLDTSSYQGVSEALNRVPGVISTPDQHGGGSQIGVRGVAAGAPYQGGSSPVGYYLDSVPLSGTNGAILPDASVYDLARIEVLRGPQGTLYGVNSVGGLVRVLTHDADLNQFDVKGRTSVQTTDGGGPSYRGDAALNLPIVEGKLAARAVVGYQNMGGWIESPVKEDINDAELRTYRLKINAQPTEQLSIGLSAWTSRQDYNAPSRSDAQGRISSDDSEPMVGDYDIYGLNLGYDFASFAVSSMTSYIDYKTDMSINLTPFGLDVPVVINLGDEVFAQELLLSSSDVGPWKWSVGALFKDQNITYFADIPGLFNNPIRIRAGSESFAAYAQVGRRFRNDQLEWALGVRTFRDRQSSAGTGTENETLPAIDGFESEATTPRAVLTWYPRSNVTVYGSYGQGFRSGGAPDPAAPELGALQPDKLHNYEVGAKADVLDGRVSLDAALYYIDWSKVQQFQSVFVDNVPYGKLLNIGDASGLGFDFTAITRPAEGLDLGLSLSWNDLTLDQDVVSATGVSFAKGDRLNYSSEYTAGVFAEYTFSFGASGWKGQLAGAANHISEQSYNGTVGDALWMVRTSFAVTSADHWTSTLYVDNLANENGGHPSQDGILEWTTRMRPRTIGLQFEYHY